MPGVLYGKSKFGNSIVNCFTIREGKIRIISSRKASRKEIKLYENNQ